MSNRTIDSGALEAEPGRDKPSASPLTSPIVALAPGAGMQFLDGFIPASLVAATARRFLEESVAGDGPEGRALYPVEIEDGVLYHPTSLAPLDPRRAHLVTGKAAIEPFLDRWVPLPYLRVLKRDLYGELAVDDGPSNWVRMFIASDDCSGEDRPAGYSVAIAIDTALDPGSREIDRPYAMPCLDDARLASVFLCPDDPALLSWFVSEPWVDDWLGELFQNSAATKATPAPSEARDAFSYEHIARYLTLLAIVRAAALAPRLRFLDPEKERAADPVGVDLVIDLGSARTAAILVERPDDADPVDRANTRDLPLRDLSRPTSIHTGPFSSRLEFARATFGNDMISRRSGRPDAFHWPSLVRIGPEADRLARLPGAHDGITGLEGPRKHLRELAPTSTIWRGRDPAHPEGEPTTLTSPLLALLTESGELRSRARRETTPALRARFSRSSTLTFFLAELLLHAWSAVDAPIRLGRDSTARVPRHLGRIVVAAPASTSPNELRALRERIESAIDLVTEALRGSGPRGAARPRPGIVLSQNEPLAGHVVYLYDAIASRLRGAPGDFFTALGRSRAEHGIHPSLRVGGLDIGAGQTTLTIATYESLPSGTILPHLALSETCPDGGEHALEAIATRHILPALDASLSGAGDAEARPVLQRLLGTAGALADAAGDRERRRFLTRVAIPLARALLEIHLQLGATRDADEIAMTLADLAERAGDVSLPAVRWLERRIADEGLGPREVLATPLVLSREALAATISSALAPIVAAASRIVDAYECDLMLLSGWPSQLAEVRGRLLEEMPLRPDRIVAMHDCPVGPWYPFRTQSGCFGDTKSMVAVGAALLARGARGPIPIDLDALRPPKESAHLSRLTEASRTSDPANLLSFGAPAAAAAVAQRAPAAAITGGGAVAAEDGSPAAGGRGPRRTKSTRSKARAR